MTPLFSNPEHIQLFYFHKEGPLSSDACGNGDKGLLTHNYREEVKETASQFLPWVETYQLAEKSTYSENINSFLVKRFPWKSILRTVKRPCHGDEICPKYR